MQPGVIADGDLLIGTGEGVGGHGVRRIAVAHRAGDGPTAGWTTEERWTSSGLKPNYADFVIHDGYAYGFDGVILACIDLKDGKRKWKRTLRSCCAIRACYWCCQKRVNWRW